MSARMTAAKKAFIPSVGPVRTPSFSPHQSIVLKCGLQGYDDTKFAPGMTSGVATEIAGHITTQCVYDLMLRALDFCRCKLTSVHSTAVAVKVGSCFGPISRTKKRHNYRVGTNGGGHSN